MIDFVLNRLPEHFPDIRFETKCIPVSAFNRERFRLRSHLDRQFLRDSQFYRICSGTSSRFCSYRLERITRLMREGWLPVARSP